jgi:pimeloyl-ACP methyl ester carboxylesterase
VVERLQTVGIQVTAPANLLREISIDSAYINSLIEQIPGPVLAVGHSYGGAVITNAATNANNVVGLVYVAAFAPDEGEKVGDLTTRFPEAAGVHRIGRTADNDRAGVHPVSRALHVQAKGGAAPPLTDSRVGDSPVPRRNSRGCRLRAAQPSWSRSRLHRARRRCNGVRR